jgi:hypothetical protein
MRSFDEEAEQNLFLQNPLQMLSDLAVLAANNYGRIDVNFSIQKHEKMN